MPLTTKTTLEIDLGALEHNYKALRSLIAPKNKFMAVVKANAYGSDASAIAKRLEELGVDYFAVAYGIEGEALRNAGIKTPILVLHPQAGQFSALFELGLEPTIYSFQGMKEAIESSSARKLPVHIKINTGLNRLGFKPSEIPEVLQLLNVSNLDVKSIYSHLIASEDPDSQLICEDQIISFNNVIAQFEGAGICPDLLHMTNTSGIINYQQAHYSMVRSGIGLYGFSNGSTTVNLKPIAKLSTVISKITSIEKGEVVGYNSGFVASAPTKVATLPIGHADGITRIYSKGKAHVWINDQPAAVLGNVCMDMMMVDVGDIDCKEGDQVILFDHKHTASEFAEAGSTISYELITGIGARVTRVLLK